MLRLALCGELFLVRYFMVGSPSNIQELKTKGLFKKVEGQQNSQPKRRQHYPR